LSGEKVDPPLLPASRLDSECDALVLAPAEERKAKLSKESKLTQRVTGAMKFFERGSVPRITRLVHCLSCVMSYPPAGALRVALSVLAHAYTHMDEEICYSATNPAMRAIDDRKMEIDLDDGAPTELEVSADASHGSPHKYGLLATKGGASVLHLTKLIGYGATSTMETESKASIKASEIAEYGATVERALGCATGKPVAVITDSLSNMRVANNSGSAAQSRHLLERYTAMKSRQDADIIATVHCNDPGMPADPFSKATAPKKREQAIRYALGNSIAQQRAASG
jgi:hypothetical protein